MSWTFERAWARALCRAALFVAAFAAGSGFVWRIGAYAVELSGADRNGTGLDLPPRVAAWRADLLKDRSPRRVAMLGDSMLFSLPGMPSVPDRVSALLRRNKAPGRRATVHALSFPVLWTISQYCLADEVVEARPDLVALELNSRALQPGSLGPFAYSELAGRIAWRRIPEASLLPLADAGITENRLLLYRLLVSAHLEGPWDALIGREARLLNSRDVFEAWLGKHVGGLSTSTVLAVAAVRNIELFTLPGSRGTDLWLRQVLGAAFEGVSQDAGRLRVLGALVRRLHDAGIPTLVWVSPMNTDHFRSLGIELRGLDRTIRSARTVVEANGGAFADFHALLTDAQFRDTSDHFTLDGEQSGGATLARRLASAVLRTLPEPQRGRASREASRAVQ